MKRGKMSTDPGVPQDDLAPDHEDERGDYEPPEDRTDDYVEPDDEADEFEAAHELEVEPVDG